MFTIGKRIKERRLQLGLTLLEVAEFLGVKEATVQRYESGEIRNIKHETVQKLSQILLCSPQYLMGWEEKELPTSNEEFVNMLRTHNQGQAQVFFCGADGKVVGLSPEEEEIMKNLLKLRKTDE